MKLNPLTEVAGCRQLVKGRRFRRNQPAGRDLVSGFGCFHLHLSCQLNGDGVSIVYLNAHVKDFL